MSNYGQQFSDDDYTAVQRSPDDPFLAPTGVLTDSERSICRYAITGGSSSETDNLIAIIERLSGEKILPLK